MCSEPERRTIVPEKAQTVPILVFYTTSVVIHVEPADQVESVVCDCRVAETKTIPPHSEAPVMLTMKSAGTFIAEPSKLKTAETTIVLVREIGEDIRDRALYFMASSVRNLPGKFSNHEKLLEFTERPTVIIKVVDNKGTVKAENKVKSINVIHA